MTTTHLRNLVVLRAGDRSLHAQWIAGAPRDFDLFISYYGPDADRYRADTPLWEARKGPKWPCIGELLDAHPELVVRYDVFWFPDDDLAVDTATINRMFALFRGFGLALAQPALTPQSYHAHPMLLQRPGHVLRHTGFVEVMAPIFDRDALRACQASFARSRSGWGLDWVWPRLVGHERRHLIALLDATPVWHTRPLGGELYRNHPEMDPHRDVERLILEYDLTPEELASQYTWDACCTKVRPAWPERIVQELRRLNRIRRMTRRIRRIRRAAAQGTDTPP
ncbi:MAG: hypothetical protein RI988_3028 [Pseudomonadota bacterium]|jgi:hypothetical protein